MELSREKKDSHSFRSWWLLEFLHHINNFCMYRVIVLFYLVFLVSHVGFAQAPQRFSFQAVIRNASNAVLGNQQVGMRISLLQGSATGSAVYVETHIVITSQNGQVNLDIGGGTVVSGSMTGINWSSGTYFIKTETDPAGGTNYSLVGTSRLLSVPYAMYAASSGNSMNNGTANNQMLYWNGSTWVTLNPGTNGQVLTICNGVLTWTTGGQCPSSPAPSADGCPSQNYFNTSVSYGSMTDQQGNTYKTVTIGGKIWMAENLRVSKYRNGDEIPNVSNFTSWAGLSTGAFCWYEDDSLNNNCNYGKMYNGYALADSRQLCPSGWHIPTNTEWNQMIDSLGGNSVAGLKLKSSIGWSGGGNGNNLSGFSALPTGYRQPDGAFQKITMQGYWWTRTVDMATNGFIGRHMYSFADDVNISGLFKGHGISIRCVKD